MPSVHSFTGDANFWDLLALVLLEFVNFISFSSCDFLILNNASKSMIIALYTYNNKICDPCFEY